MKGENRGLLLVLNSCMWELHIIFLWIWTHVGLNFPFSFVFTDVSLFQGYRQDARSTLEHMSCVMLCPSCSLALLPTPPFIRILRLFVHGWQKVVVKYVPGAWWPQVLPCVHANLEDYTTDNRGDVGSWVREASMDVLEVGVVKVVCLPSDSCPDPSWWCVCLLLLVRTPMDVLEVGV